jgi:hypothetical protein
MNITLDLSKGQLSKLLNGHAIRITSTMLGSGVDLIIDPITYHNMAKKKDKGKGVVFKMGSNGIQMIIIEGTGLFAGSGNESGKISQLRKRINGVILVLILLNKVLILLHTVIKNTKKQRILLVQK